MSMTAISSPRRPKAEAAFLYDADHAQRLLSIIDQDHTGVPSVTTDIRNVLADITHAEELVTLAGWQATYRDTEGDWCRIVLSERGEYDQICGFGVRVTSEADALERLRALAA